MSLLPFLEQVQQHDMPAYIKEYTDRISSQINQYKSFLKLSQFGYAGEYIYPPIEKLSALYIAPIVFACNPIDRTFNQEIFTLASEFFKSLQTEYDTKEMVNSFKQIHETTAITSEIPEQVLHDVTIQWKEAELLLQNYWYISKIPQFRTANLLYAQQKIMESTNKLLINIKDRGGQDSELFSYVDQTTTILNELLSDESSFQANYYDNTNYAMYLLYRLRLALHGLFCEPQNFSLQAVPIDEYNNYIFDSPKHLANRRRWKIYFN